MASIFDYNGIPIYGPDIRKGVLRIAHPSDDFITGYDSIYLFASTAVFLLYTIIKEIQLVLCRPKFGVNANKFAEGMEEEEDDDVRAERARIKRFAEGMDGGEYDGQNEDVVIVDDLKKAYGKELAVKGVSYGVKRGQCFSLLGVNGAGKTTTFKMLTGDIVPTSGSARIGGFSVKTNMNKARQMIGYCPQFGGLLRLVTVREHLELYAKVKGIAPNEVSEAVEEKIDQLGLRPFANVLSKDLSGGNQRKLSVAIATMGNPAVVFLDEPSTGMDPASRRFMWNFISSKSMSQSAIILTTHSMEESEALSNQVAIMVAGRLRCIGSIQHLKNTYGKGIMVDVKFDFHPSRISTLCLPALSLLATLI